MIAYLVKNGIIVARRTGPQEDIEYDAALLGADLAPPATGLDESVRLDELYVLNGVVSRTPPRPPGVCTFDAATLAWVDTRSLQARQDEKWEQTKGERAKAVAAPLVTPYGVFDADLDSRSNITDAVLMLQTLAAIGQPSTITFTLADNTDVTLTTTQMIEVGLLLGQQVQAAYAIGRALRTALDAATTADEVEAIAWPS